MKWEDEAAVRAELAAICAGFGKADAARRLLTYLVECYLRDKVPKETDIAFDVFQRDASFDGSQDAVVRVAVRALRQKLDEYYREAGRDRPLRLELPRGGYRIHVVPAEEVVAVTADAAESPRAAPEGGSSPEPATQPAPHRQLRWALGALAVMLVASLVLNVWAWQTRGIPATDAADPARESAVWAPLLLGDRPLTIVLGDHLLFPNPNPDPGRIQLIRDARINTDEQLRAFLDQYPDRPSTEPGTQVATTLIPKSVALGLVDILPVVGKAGRRVNVRILDELPIDDLRTHDVLFMGPLVRIGPLADALFRDSRYIFEYDDEPRRLRDLVAGHTYQPSPGRRENAIDYGLLASFRGPAGNRIMVFASVGSDLGLMPLIRRATSPQGLAELLERLTQGGTRPMPEQFEALIEVSGYYRTDLSAKLIDAHPRPGISASETPAMPAATQTR